MAEVETSVTIGRYLLHRQIARGGMATIHIARLLGDEGFTRIVAAKRLLPEFAEDTDFVAMFMDEARIASKVHHPNVVPVLDLVTTADEVMLVQEYVHGVPLHVLLRTAHQAQVHIPTKIAVSIACQVLAGLHAAHETVDELGAPLGIVHRDVSPQNVMVATDGTARLLDFGVAKATMAAHVTRAGTFKGKLAYSAPEQLRGAAVRQSDVYSLAVVLWELLVGQRMHGSAQGEAELVATIMAGALPTLTEALASEGEWGAITPEDWAQLERIQPVVQKGLAVEVADRWATAAELEEALTAVAPAASQTELAAWLKALAKDFLEARDRMLAAEEASWRRSTHVGSIARRMTTVPGTLRTIAPPVEPTLARPVAPPHSSKPVIAVLGALVVLLGAGFVYTLQSTSAAEPAAMASAPAPVVTPVAVASPAPAIAVAPLPAPEPTVAPLPAPEPAVPRRPALPPPIRRSVRPAARPAPAEPLAPPVVVPPPQAPDVPPSPPPATVSCNPPYYFEGQKKLFKPSCL